MSPPEDKKPEEEQEKIQKPQKASAEEIEQGHVAGEEEEERERAEREFRKPPRRRPVSAMAVYKPAIVVGIAVLLIAYLMMGAIGVSKSDFTRNIQDMLATVETVKKEATTNKAVVEGAVANLPNIVTAQMAAMIQEYTAWQGRANSWISVTDTRLAGLESRTNTDNPKIDEANARITEADNKIEEVTTLVTDIDGWRGRANSHISTTNTRLDDIEALLDELENGIVVDGDDDGCPIELSVSSMGNILISTDNNTLSSPLKLTLTKAKGVGVEDITLFVAVEMQGIPHWNSVTLTGGGVAWRVYDRQSNDNYLYGASFMNSSWGLNMATNDTKKNLYLNLTVKGDNTYDYTEKEYAYDVDAEIDDWSQ